jgi:glycine C-acetyltransferase
MAYSTRVHEHFTSILQEMESAHLLKEERVLHSPQTPDLLVEFAAGSQKRSTINFCANNYLGLANHPALISAAKKMLDERGYGLSSVRFICGTQDIHLQLEQELSAFLRMEDTILYSSCFDANGGVFETLLGEEDVILSDELNHASIIDGIRLCRAHRHRYKHNDMHDLELQLQQTRHRRIRLIVTDGVFSMDGELAHLPEICRLAEQYDALLMIDDSHATGFVGPTGRGTPEHWTVEGKIDLISTTFGKALGGASGGCVSGTKALIDVLRQRSRPYTFSNTLSPPVVGATLAALKLLEQSGELREKLFRNTTFFRQQITAAGFEIIPGFHPIVPVMLHDARIVQTMARDLYEEGIYVIGFVYPVVPKEKARIRVQISAAHEQHHLEQAIDSFRRVGRKLGIIH